MKLGKLFLIGFFVLIAINNAVAQPYAVKNFENFSGLKIKPTKNFVLCLGTSNNPLECKPSAGSWVKVQSVPYITLNIAKDETEVDKKIQNQITDKYLGAAYYLSTSPKGFLDNSCMPTDNPSSKMLSSVFYDSPVRSTGIAQLIEEEVVREAKIKFKSLIEANKLGNKGKLETAFEASLRSTIKGNSSNKADVKWVTVQLQADFNRLKDFTSFSPCIEFAKNRKGSIVNGIAGYVIMSSAVSSDYVTTKSFEIAANAAFSAEGGAASLPSGIDKAVADFAGQWSSSTNRKISTSIESKTPVPTFYPLWVSFTRAN